MEKKTYGKTSRKLIWFRLENTVEEGPESSSVTWKMITDKMHSFFEVQSKRRRIRVRKVQEQGFLLQIGKIDLHKNNDYRSRLTRRTMKSPLIEIVTVHRDKTSCKLIFQQWIGPDDFSTY